MIFSSKCIIKRLASAVELTALSDTLAGLRDGYGMVGREERRKVRDTPLLQTDCLHWTLLTYL